MTRRAIGETLAVLLGLPLVGCLEWLSPGPTEVGTVQVRLINDSSTQYVAPNLGVCPYGMATPPHYFVNPAPVLGPGEEITYTTDQLAGDEGNCLVFTTDFTIGLCGYSYGTQADSLTPVEGPYRGLIGVHFSCGDTVVLRWSDAQDQQGAWSSEVEPAPGNPQPTEDFGPP